MDLDCFDECSSYRVSGHITNERFSSPEEAIIQYLDDEDGEVEVFKAGVSLEEFVLEVDGFFCFDDSSSSSHRFFDGRHIAEVIRKHTDWYQLWREEDGTENRFCCRVEQHDTSFHWGSHKAAILEFFRDENMLRMDLRCGAVDWDSLIVLEWDESDPENVSRCRYTLQELKRMFLESDKEVRESTDSMEVEATGGQVLEKYRSHRNLMWECPGGGCDGRRWLECFGCKQKRHEATERMEKWMSEWWPTKVPPSASDVPKEKAEPKPPRQPCYGCRGLLDELRRALKKAIKG